MPQRVVLRANMLTIGIVALEPSADILGAGLMQALLKQNPEIQFIGVGGPRMAALGFNSLYPFSELSHMGFVEVIKHLPKLLSARRLLLSHFIHANIDLFIGIDAPDFNLYLEERLKKQAIKTVHYVSPSVWAWRQGRIHRIKRAVDLLLTLFPFEAQFYQQQALEVKFVGHPLADDIPLAMDNMVARRALQITESAKIIAIFPGSRSAEVKYMARTFMLAAQLCYEQDKDLKFLIALPNKALQQQFLSLCGDVLKNLPATVHIGQSHAVLAAADVVLVKSGTVTLEALLYKKPMVVSYIASAISFWIARRLVHVKYISLPNLLADKSLVPEILQQDATPIALATALLEYFKEPKMTIALKEEYGRIHHQLRLNASDTAAAAIVTLLNNR